MKKWLCVLLTLCMVLTLAACGEKTTPSGDNKGDATAENVEVELTKPITITFWHGIVQENMQKPSTRSWTHSTMASARKWASPWIARRRAK